MLLPGMEACPRQEWRGTVTEIHPEQIAPCGLYCGVCRIRHATQENDLAYLKRLARIYARRFPEIAGARPEDLLCDGCLSARRFPFCQECAIRDCTQQKGYQGCHQCSEFPCALIQGFPMPAGQKVMLRSIPYWRTHGTAAWIATEEARYRCPACGHRLFRGARQCEQCRAPASVD
jgi:hypothetical protein